MHTVHLCGLSNLLCPACRGTPAQQEHRPPLHPGETFGGRHVLQDPVGQENAPAPDTKTYVSVYSALHDPEAGTTYPNLVTFHCSELPASELVWHLFSTGVTL